jgi:hypothetical protein
MLLVPSREKIFDLVLRIRREHSMEESYPVIKEVIDGPHLFIIVEDRPDKSIFIGSSIVAGKLRKILGKPVTIIAETDLIVKRRKIEENMKYLRTISSKHGERLYALCEEEKKYPLSTPLSFPHCGESFILCCNNAYALTFSEMMGLTPICVTYRYSFPQTTKTHHSIHVDGDFRCDVCVSRLLEEASELADQKGIDIIFADLEVAVEERAGLLIVNPQRLLHRTDWELHRSERCLRMNPDEENMRFWIERITKKVSEGLIEPNEGARKIHALLERVTT